MTTQYDANCEKFEDKNGEVFLRFLVMGPNKYDSRFNGIYSSEEVDRLIEHSDTSDYELSGIGWVPVVHNQGWEIDWEGLESYSLE